MKHFLTYQHNVQKYFQTHVDKYDGIIIPLSIAISFPGGTFGFIQALCTKTSDKRYAIDPRTPLFQKTWNRDHVRDPHKKMAEVFGAPYDESGIKSFLTPGEFDSETIEKTTKNCIGFQLDYRGQENEKRKADKYKKLLGIDTLDELAEPVFLIPPYFEITSITDPWWGVNVSCITHTLTCNKGVPVRPVIHSSTALSYADWTHIVGVLITLGIEEVFIYPNNFKEHEANSTLLQNHKKSIEICTENGLKPYSLFGGYLAISMGYFGLDGFANGIGYGEWRDSNYHRGGQAGNRVYVYKLHRYLEPAAAQTLLDFHPSHFGESDLFIECAETGRSLVELSQAECNDHFLDCRVREIEFCESNSAADAASELGETIDVLKKNPIMYNQYGKSLERWVKLILPD